MKILNETRLAYLVTKIRSLISGKQDKIALPDDATKFYNGKGQFAVPPDTKYGAVSDSTNGLMTTEQKKKLDGIATGANAVPLPVSVANGGTGANDAAAARTNLLAMGVAKNDGYWGFSLPNNDTSGWIRATENGLIPIAADSANGRSNIGTAGWPFSSVYAKNFYGTFNGNATTATSVSGTVGVDHGGTGATTAKAAMSKLGGLFTAGAWDELPANANLNAAPYINSGQWCHRVNVAYTGGPSGLTEWFQLFTIESFSDGNARTQIIITLSGRLLIRNITKAGADSWGGWKEFGTGSVGRIDTNGNSSQFLRGDGTWGAAGSDLVEVTDAEIDAVLALI